MIESIRGKLLVLHEDGLTVEVGGLGLRLQVPASVISRLSALWEGTAGRPSVTLATHLLIRPDSWQLFGFSNEPQRDLFRVLLGIPGIGPRLAMSLLSHRSMEEIESAIVAGDSHCFEAVPGIGKRTAARIVLELTGKLQGVQEAPAGGRVAPAGQDAVDALVALGIARQEALSLVHVAARDQDGEPNVSALVATALRLRQMRR